MSFVCRPSVKRTKTELECEWRVEYVTESSGVTGEENHSGWVVKEAIGDLHELKYRQGSFHALETDQDDISGVRHGTQELWYTTDHQTETFYTMVKENERGDIEIKDNVVFK